MTDHPIRPEEVADAPQPPATADVQVAMYQRESPLPRPEELRGYFDISAEVGDRILKMAEQAATHRHEMQRKTLSSSVVLILCTTVMILGVVAGAVWLAVEVTPAGGVALGVSPLGWIAVTVLLARRGRRREQSEDR
ncbi:MAG: DUF2335 domain-containing protein [bacterium]|nr:DUF2335 domain-containing protein [bacterium]